MSVTDRFGWTPRPAVRAYNEAYRLPPNWDIGRPQRAFVLLEEAGYVETPVIDLGCGTGELAMFLASRGYDVLGIDFAPLAIQQAREKARWRRLDVRFLVWDALRLDELPVTVRTVTDSAMLHVLGDRERDVVVDGLETILEPGGRYLLFCDARSEGNPHGGGLSRAEIDRRFARRDGWRVDFVYDTVFERRYSRNAAFIASITWLGEPDG